MNSVILLIIGIPIIEIYLFIKIGSQIGAFNTISLIFLTAIIGVAYAKHEGFNTLRSGISGLMKNEIPIYEIISGAALAFAAILLILPGFATDLLGILLVFPLTRKIFIKYFSRSYYKNKNTYKEKNFIDGEFKDIDDEK
tara:strand:- start:1397 stop:1816 length:420 start_codon:yes stop_codon:yes gene_type:complete